MKIKKILLFIIITSAISWGYQQNANGSQALKMVSGSTFKNSSFIIDGDYQSVSELSFPDELNQFLIFDLMRDVQISTIKIHLGINTPLGAQDIEIFLGHNVIGWKKIKTKAILDNGVIIINLKENSGRYLRVNLSEKHYYQPLFIREIEVFTKQPRQQNIYDVDIPQNLISTSSVVVKYSTKQPTTTYLLYGNNFDFIYEGTISQVYSDLNNTTQHQIVLKNLIPKTTYVFRIGIKDAEGKKQLSEYLNFSTKGE